MKTYLVTVDTNSIGNLRNEGLLDWQIDRMKATFAKEWGISPKGISIEPNKVWKITHNGKVN